MFTGIITDIGTVAGIEQRADLRVRIGCGYDVSTIDLGASIACSGVCLTVVDKALEESGSWFAVDISAETLSRTASGLWKHGARLNLERPLKVGDELGGHFVTGHVDCIGEVVEIHPEGGSTRIVLSIPAALAPMVAAKGSIALDGVSLTVNEIRQSGDNSMHFSVNVIPHTAEHTTLGEMGTRRHLNVEIDVLARYIDRMLATKTQ
jgi:riboflavin synthase